MPTKSTILHFVIFDFYFRFFLSRIFSFFCSIYHLTLSFFFFLFFLSCHLPSSSPYTHTSSHVAIRCCIFAHYESTSIQCRDDSLQFKPNPYLSIVKTIGACILHHATIDFCLGWIAYLYVPLGRRIRYFWFERMQCAGMENLLGFLPLSIFFWYLRT